MASSRRTGRVVGQQVGYSQVVAFLAEGGFGKVFRLKDAKSSKELATKEIDLAVLKPHEIKSLKWEVYIHEKLNHQNIIKFYRADRSNDFIYLDMELAASCLFEEIENGLSPELSRQYFRQLIIGVRYLHSEGVAHRDIKPENLLIGCDGLLKITDFGLSMLTRHAEQATASGTREYMAPEVLRRCGSYQLEPTDVWSCGVVLVVMLTREMPWQTAVSREYGSGRRIPVALHSTA
jgi:serine/threonine-protein kinase Chk1